MQLRRLLCSHTWEYVGSTKAGYIVEVCSKCGSTRSVEHEVARTYAIGLNESGIPVVSTTSDMKVVIEGRKWYQGLDTVMLIELLQNHIVNLSNSNTKLCETNNRLMEKLQNQKSIIEQLQTNKEGLEKLINECNIVIPHDTTYPELYMELRRFVKQLSSIDIDSIIELSGNEIHEFDLTTGKFLKLFLIMHYGYDKLYDKLKWNIVGDKYIFSKRLNRKK